jgi:hypothetical protein
MLGRACRYWRIGGAGDLRADVRNAQQKVEG